MREADFSHAFYFATMNLKKQWTNVLVHDMI